MIWRFFWRQVWFWSERSRISLGPLAPFVFNQMMELHKPTQMKDEIKARSDVDNFPTVGEALDEALIRAEDGNVFIHKPDDSRLHDLENGEACWCNPAKIEGTDFNQ